VALPVKPQLLFPLGLAIIAVALGLWLWQRPDPKEALIREIEHNLEQLNKGNHQIVLKLLSPEMVDYLRDEAMGARRAVMMVRKWDADQDRAYRFQGLRIFLEGDYAEAELERSAPNREFTGKGIFVVPFIYADKKWWIGGSFRSDTYWHFPE
jgi:hypothetical protein